MGPAMSWALAIGMAVLVGAAVAGFAALRGAMDHGGPAMAPHGSEQAAPDGALAQGPTRSTPLKGAVYVLLPASAEGLDAGVLQKLEGLPGVVEVQGFLVITRGQGGPAQGLTPGREVFAVDGGRLVAIAPALRWGRVFTPQEADQPVAIAGRRWAETHRSTDGFLVSGMGHPTPVEVGGIQVTVVGEFETGRPLDAGLIMPLDVARRVYGLGGSLSGAVVRARLDRASLGKAVAEAVATPLEIRPAAR